MGKNPLLLVPYNHVIDTVLHVVQYHLVLAVTHGFQVLEKLD